MKSNYSMQYLLLTVAIDAAPRRRIVMTSKVCQLLQQTLLTTVIHNFECPAVDPRKYKRTEAYITYSTVNDGEGLVGCRPFVGELDQLRNSEEFLRFERQT